MHPMGVKPLKKISRRWGMQGRRCLGPPRHAGTLAPYRPRRPVAVAPRPPPWGGLPPRQRHSPAFRGARSFAGDRLACPSWHRSPRRPRCPSPLPLAPVPLPAAPPRGGVSGARLGPGLPRLHGMAWGRASLGGAGLHAPWMSDCVATGHGHRWPPSLPQRRDGWHGVACGHRRLGAPAPRPWTPQPPSHPFVFKIRRFSLDIFGSA
jgi:hypothetical protein